MKYAETPSAAVENVGARDRFHRVIVGIAAIIAAVLLPAIPAGDPSFTWQVVTAVFALLWIIAGVIDWDFMSAFVKDLHQRTPRSALETPAVYPRHEKPAAADSYKEAA